MKRSVLEDRIRANLRAEKLGVEEIVVQADPFGGWRIAVVSPDFEGMSSPVREAIALEGLDQLEIRWIDLLTPAEREWAGTLPAETSTDQLPLWAESLSRERDPSEVVFPSDLERDLPLPIIVTFYSVRGGVGRSTALAQVARLLAEQRRSVLCVDADLEAPGLAALFDRESEIEPGSGLLSVLLSLDQGEEVDVVEHIIRLSESEELYCLPAGVPDARYARQLRFVDVEAWYREELNPLRETVNRFGDLPFSPDVVLFDARTGMSPISAPLLFDLSDLAVNVFFPHPQAKTATSALVRGLLRAVNRRSEFMEERLAPDPRFLVSLVPPRESDHYRLRAENWIRQWTEELNEARRDEWPSVEPQDVLHLIPYREEIALSDDVYIADDLRSSYAPVADWISRFLPIGSEKHIPEVLPRVKNDVLKSLHFSADVAEQQENLRQNFVQTDTFDRALSPEKPLVLGRKGTGKTALFRWILEQDPQDAIVVTCPSPMRPEYPWVPSSHGFAKIEDALRSNEGVGWRSFWTLFCATAAFRGLAGQKESSVAAPPSELGIDASDLLLDGDARESEHLDPLVKALGSGENIPFKSWEWLRSLDDTSPSQFLLLFDGLDTGFGNEQGERTRRRRALEGLFAFFLEREAQLDVLRFKVLLREDIWRGLTFENKSHLFGRSVRLEWRNQIDYLRTVVVQALRDEQFLQLVKGITPDRSVNDIEHWAEADVNRIWSILVRERMHGGKTTYTRNWVWNRLADGNGDHSPRSLLILFREAREWEVHEHKRKPYDGSVIRPRALIESLSEVSRQAVDALEEEFGELADLVERLRSVGSGPVVEARKLEDLEEQVSLALEVGLLDEYEEEAGEAVRYKVPELYRIELGIKRRGPK